MLNLLLFSCFLFIMKILSMDPKSIHLGLLSPKSDNRLYLEVLFWGCTVCACLHASKASLHPLHRQAACPGTFSWICLHGVLIHCRINSSLINLSFSPSFILCSLIEFLMACFQSGRQETIKQTRLGKCAITSYFCLQKTLNADIQTLL